MATSDRARKVEKIFKQFDANADGRLNRSEMAALVIAVNPRVKFSDEQIRAILDEVFRTYGEFIKDDKGLSLQGLLRTYDDGAGDVDRDFDALGLRLDDDVEEPATDSVTDDRTIPAAGPVSIMDERADVQRRRNVGAWATSPNNGIIYDSTWIIIEDLEILLRRTEARRKTGGKTSAAARVELAESELKEVGQLRARADTSRTQDEAFDAHMAMGRSLSEHGFFEQALVSFKRATELRPTDARPHFRAGNTLYQLHRCSEARDAYEAALEAAPSGGGAGGLAAQIHVNLGIALECDGMLLNACEHYREAAILHPSHHRALKLLGSALLGVGEYRAAEKALGEAVFLSPEYADAHCDLGSALHALGDDERAAAEFQRAIDCQADHVEALYNLAGLLRDGGNFQGAAEVYYRVLTLQPGNWKAQLNRAAALLGCGNVDEARKSLKAAFRMSSRVEIYDALGHLKVLLKTGVDPGSGIVTVEASKFEAATGKTTTTTPRPWLSMALSVRGLQLLARLHKCGISSLRSAIVEDKLLPPLSQAAGSVSEKVMRKSDVEQWLRRTMFPSGSSEAFAACVKAINERLLGALDRSGSGRIDFGMLLACMAPLCSGQVEKRKRMAFDSLVWRSSRGLGAEIMRSDAKAYFRHVRAIYMPQQQQQGDILWEVRGAEEEQASMSFPEFVDMFDDPDWGFGILSTLVKLESYDRVRHGGLVCASCCYPIVGLRFREVERGFDLCSLCYSEGKVPAAFVAKTDDDMFTFKELKRPGTVTDKLRFKLGQHHKQPQNHSSNN